MNNNPSVLKMPNQEVKEDLFEQGDMCLVLKANGDVTNVVFGVDTEGLKNLDPDTATDEQLATLLRGQALYSLTLAAQIPMVMKILTEIANNPDVINFEELLQRARPQ